MPPARLRFLSRQLFCRAGALAALLALWGGAWSFAEEIGEDRALAGLRDGGYVIYLRHADRFAGPKENLTRLSSRADFADCASQRNLTPQGREDAKAIGRYLLGSGIPIGRVVANAQCRTRDTAMLAFGRAELEPRVFDVSFVRNLLTQRQPAGSNLVVVGNDWQMRELSGIDLGRGEAVIIRPEESRGFEVVARFDLEDWKEAASAVW
jgi:hypothetical protein